MWLVNVHGGREGIFMQWICRLHMSWTMTGSPNPKIAYSLGSVDIARPENVGMSGKRHCSAKVLPKTVQGEFALASMALHREPESLVGLETPRSPQAPSWVKAAETHGTRRCTGFN